MKQSEVKPWMCRCEECIDERPERFSSTVVHPEDLNKFKQTPSDIADEYHLESDKCVLEPHEVDCLLGNRLVWE